MIKLLGEIIAVQRRKVQKIKEEYKHENNLLAIATQRLKQEESKDVLKNE